MECAEEHGLWEVERIRCKRDHEVPEVPPGHNGKTMPGKDTAAFAISFCPKARLLMDTGRLGGVLLPQMPACCQSGNVERDPQRLCDAQVREIDPRMWAC